ncbi:hypothetical protein MMC07_006124 [Pseudocyphellaria aurata]|nr:hypothetical protein [Pseudocyphellaria aurata]
MSNFNGSFARETWALYGAGILVIILRFAARIRQVGIAKCQGDDYLMINATIWYTLLVVSINKIIFGGGSNFMTPDEEAALTPETVRERITGSKWVFVSEQAMILTIWSLKLCMLSIYRRLTEGLKQKKLINMLFIWVACGFIGTELCLFLACRPFTQYWAVPAPDVQCASYQHYEITESLFNTSSDIMMLVIAIPLLISIRLPVQQKVVLLIIFGMGVFVIVSAILTKIYCLVPSLVTYVYLKWYFREASVSVYVTNLPALWSLLRDIFPHLKSWGFESNTSSVSGKAFPSSMGTSRRQSRTRVNPRSFNMQSLTRLANIGGDPHQLNPSQERINAMGEDILTYTAPRTLEIQRDITFTVEKESNDDLESGNLEDFVPQQRGETRCTSSR